MSRRKLNDAPRWRPDVAAWRAVELLPFSVDPPGGARMEFEPEGRFGGKVVVERVGVIDASGRWSRVVAGVVEISPADSERGQDGRLHSRLSVYVVVDAIRLGYDMDAEVRVLCAPEDVNAVVRALVVGALADMGRRMLERDAAPKEPPP